MITCSRACGTLQRHRSRNKPVKCVVCGVVVHDKRLVMEYLMFPELKGNPHICSACIFEKLTGNKGEWV